MDMVNRVSTSTTWVAKDTAAIESCERKSSMIASDTGTNANTKFCSVIGRISEISFFLKDVSLICVMFKNLSYFPYSFKQKWNSNAKPDKKQILFEKFIDIYASKKTIKIKYF